ncbi:hypothetical protein NC996_26125, partial [Trichocoleus sp. ST-U2]
GKTEVVSPRAVLPPSIVLDPMLRSWLLEDVGRGDRSSYSTRCRCGVAMNHRMELDDAVMIKDNHISVAGGIGEAIARIRR